MSEHGRVVGELADTRGAKVRIGVERDIVIILTEPADAALRLDAAQRDLFARLYFDAEAEAEKWQQEHEPPRADGDCRCSVGGESSCPCDADGEPDGLCACCRSNEHRGSCEPQTAPVTP